jgi:hypothetical protein
MAQATSKPASPPEGTNFPVIRDKAIVAKAEEYVLARPSSTGSRTA